MLRQLPTPLRRIQMPAAVGFVLVMGGVARADLPLNIQTAMFKKILAYDRILAAAAPSILVMYVDNRGDADHVVEGFRSRGLKAESVRVSPAPTTLEGANVVYLMKGAHSEALKALCVREGALTITGVAELVLQGQASVAVTPTESGRPGIVVHLPSVRLEKHELEAALLSLAKVIR